MDVIPVIDVVHGKVVRAVKGDRRAYLPITTPLSPSADPRDIARGLRSLYPFRRLYLADLDGIEGRGRNTHLIPALSEVWPDLEIWIDAGTGSKGAARSLLAAPITTLVIGSESIETVRDWREIASEAPARTVLSLDFRGQEFMGPAALLTDASLWPSRVIVMTLAKVGSAEGPDFERLQEISTRAGSKKVYAAGGIRDLADLKRLQTARISGALVSTALHAGNITADDLNKITGRKM